MATLVYNNRPSLRPSRAFNSLLGQVLRGGSGQQGGLLVTLGLGDLLAQTLLLGTGRLMGRDRVPASLIGGDELVDHRWVLTPGDLGTTDDVWICAQQLGVDHG